MTVEDLAASVETVSLRQCVILVDKAGPDLRPLLACGDHPFLFWQMREFIRFGVREFLILTEHSGGQLEAALPGIQAELPVEVGVRVLPAPAGAGTSGAIFAARALLENRFLLCDGDCLFDCNLAVLLAGAVADRRAVHRAICGTREVGIAIIRRDALLPRLGARRSLEAEILPALAAEGEVGGTVCEGYFVDLGEAGELLRARSELPLRLRRPALFLDRDGVLNHDVGWVGHRDRFAWIDGAIAAVAAATQAGWHVFVVSNQSGVARGLFTERDVQDLFASITEEIRMAGGTIDDVRYCPFHPEGVVAGYARHSDWRKPQPGMLLDLIGRWRLEPSRCHMVGDQVTDLQAAAAAGVEATMFAGGDLSELVAMLMRGRIWRAD